MGGIAQNLPPAPINSLPVVPFLTQPNGVGGQGGPIYTLAQVILGWIFWALIVFSVVMALVAAYRYATSAGEPERVKKAGRTLLYAAVAVIVALVAGAIPYLVGSILGVNFNVGQFY